MIAFLAPCCERRRCRLAEVAGVQLAQGAYDFDSLVTEWLLMSQLRSHLAPALQCRLNITLISNMHITEMTSRIEHSTSVDYGRFMLHDKRGGSSTLGRDSERAPEQVVGRRTLVEQTTTDNSGVASSGRSAGSPLDPTMRTGFERLLQRPIGDVRVHNDPGNVQSARALGTQAFTRGRDVVVDGPIRADSADGVQLLAHELVHVAQQSGAGSGLAGGVADTADPAEHEADRAVDAMTGMAHGEQPIRRLELGRSADPNLIYRAPPQGKTGMTPEQKARFFEWWKRIAGLEGSYDAWKANPANAADRGGETNWGVTWDTYKARYPNGTKEQFKAMTPDQAQSFGRGTYGAAHIEQIENTGVSVQVADMFWGGNYDPKLMNRALAAAGGDGTIAKGALPEQATLDEINEVDQSKLVDALYDERDQQITNTVTKSPSQKVFEKGWRTRNLSRWVQAKMANGETQRAAHWLNGQSPDIIKEQLAQLSAAERAALHDAAVADPAVGKDSNIAKLTEPTHQPS